MKYFEMHEIVYKKIKEDGLLSWDKSKSFDEMWSHHTNLYLKKFLDKKGLSFSGKRVLDLGTGTGTSALYAAKEGAISVGVEVSKTAIEVARANAHKLALDVEFIVGDVLELELNKKFDLVIDSTILHCIVGASDRKKFYETVKRHLDPNGYLFINTMIASENMSSRFPHEYFHFEDDVLWSLGINEISERKIINGKSYFPHRTLLSKEKQMQEFATYGFEVVDMELDTKGTDAGLVGLLRLKHGK